MEALRTLLVIVWTYPFLAVVVTVVIALVVFGTVDTAWEKAEERRRQKDPSYWW